MRECEKKYEEIHAGESEGPEGAVVLQRVGQSLAASVANTLASFAVPLHHSVTSMDLG